MKYMLLICHGDGPGDLTPEETQEMYAAWGALHEVPGFTPGERMGEPDTATTVRVQDGSTLTTDGPFVETKEALGGYCFFEGEDLDAAIAFAAKIPVTWLNGSVEIRPLVG